MLQEQTEIIELPYDQSKICVRIDENIGFVGIEMGKLKCYTCRFNTSKCCHVLHVKSATDSENSYVPNVAYDIVSKQGEEWKPTSFKLQEPVSKLRVPFQLTPQLAKKLSTDFAQFLESDVDVYILKPQQTTCTVCGSCLKTTEDTILVPLFNRIRQLQCKGRYLLHILVKKRKRFCCIRGKIWDFAILIKICWFSVLVVAVDKKFNNSLPFCELNS